MINELNKRLMYKNDIKGLQFVALEILKEFDKICRENNIEYWITDGTLLGAIRDKKFIPWDDDIDVCVESKNYKKLKKILEKRLPYFYYLTNENIDTNNPYLPFYKIRDRYSKALEPKNGNRQTGIWIDIFPMTPIKENKLINYIIKKIPEKKKSINDNKIKKQIRNLIYILMKWLGYDTKRSVCEEYFQKLTKKEEKYKNSLIYLEGQEWWHMYKKEWIYPLKEIEFEGYKFFSPNNPKKYLESYYGKDYMKLPPENKRRSHTVKIDLFNSNNHPESLKWKEREEHLKKYMLERDTYEN